MNGEIKEVERELKIRAVKLASNENPLGPSPMAMEAARKALSESHRYPDGGTQAIREMLSEKTVAVLSGYNVVEWRVDLAVV